MLTPLRIKRIMSELTLHDVARRANMSTAKLSLIERKLESAKPTEKEQLARVLCCEIKEVFPDEI